MKTCYFKNIFLFKALAVYDRFGRLMYGSEIIAKDILEYVVFEKHLANEYGKWRVHDKIIPDWMPARESSSLTYKDPLKNTTPSKDAPIIQIDKGDDRP